MPSRILREGILTSERVDMLGPQGEIFYRRLMSVVDDFGRFDGRPQMLRVSCFPLRVDRVREADISRWLVECQTAGLIALYAVNGKQFLEMLDFRQQVRAKESKFPAREQQMQSDCVADATQMQSDCVADVHLGEDGVGVVSEDVDDKPPNQPTRELASDVRFEITPEWEPSPHFSSLARSAGMVVPGSEEFSSALGEFIFYWITQKQKRTQHEWDHALVKSLKAEKLRAKSPLSQRSKPTQENFTEKNYGTGVTAL